MGETRAGRWVAAVMLTLVVLWAERWTLRRAAVADASGCPPWYGLEVDGQRIWTGDPQQAARAAAGCAGEADPTPATILSVIRDEGGCRVTERPMTARQRLALGLPLAVNTASPAALQVVPGIGPATAAAIVAARPFARLVDLERVRGIGPARRRALADHLTVRALARPWPSCRPRAASAPQRP